jgi:hypothetical protein
MKQYIKIMILYRIKFYFLKLKKQKVKDTDRFIY